MAIFKKNKNKTPQSLDNVDTRIIALSGEEGTTTTTTTAEPTTTTTTTAEPTTTTTTPEPTIIPQSIYTGGVRGLGSKPSSFAIKKSEPDRRIRRF